MQRSSPCRHPLRGTFLRRLPLPTVAYIPPTAASTTPSADDVSSTAGIKLMISWP